MKYLEIIISFLILTSLTLITIASIRELNQIDIEHKIVKPIIYNQIQK